MKSILAIVLATIMAGASHAQSCGRSGGFRNSSQVGGPPNLLRMTTGWPTPMMPTPVLSTPNWTVGMPFPTWNVANPITRSTTSPVNPVVKRSSSSDPIKRDVDDPDRYLLRSEDEKDRYVRNALQRGYQAEQDGNMGLARACYVNAATVYPDAALVDQAKASLARVR